MFTGRMEDDSSICRFCSTHGKKVDLISVEEVNGNTLEYICPNENCNFAPTLWSIAETLGELNELMSIAVKEENLRNAACMSKEHSIGSFEKEDQSISPKALLTECKFISCKSDVDYSGDSDGLKIVIDETPVETNDEIDESSSADLKTAKVESSVKNKEKGKKISKVNIKKKKRCLKRKKAKNVLRSPVESLLSSPSTSGQKNFKRISSPTVIALTSSPSTKLIPPTSSPSVKVLPSTSSPLTRVVPTTSSPLTRVVPTTSSPLVNKVLPSTSLPLTRVIPEKASPSVKVLLPTSSPLTKVLPSTSSPSVKVLQSTSSPSTRVIPTASSPLMKVLPSTSSPFIHLRFPKRKTTKSSTDEKVLKTSHCETSNNTVSEKVTSPISSGLKTAEKTVLRDTDIENSSPVSLRSAQKTFPSMNPLESSSNGIVPMIEDFELSSSCKNFLNWPDSQSLSWLNSTLILLIHSYNIQNLLRKNDLKNSHISRIIVEYRVVLKEINKPVLGPVTYNKLLRSLILMQNSVMTDFQKGSKNLYGTPVYALTVLVNESEEIKQIFEHSFQWSQKCDDCRVSSSSQAVRSLTSFPKVADDFCMKAPSTIDVCKVCLKQNQKRNFVFNKMSESIVCHFETGFPYKDVRSCDFEMGGHSYAVKGVILCTELNQQKHFITWIRDWKSDMWMECNDSQIGLQTFSVESPNFKALEIYIMMWERLPVSASINTNTVVSATEKPSTLDHAYCNQTNSDSEVNKVETSSSARPMSMPNSLTVEKEQRPQIKLPAFETSFYSFSKLKKSNNFVKKSPVIVRSSSVLLNKRSVNNSAVERIETPASPPLHEKSAFDSFPQSKPSRTEYIEPDGTKIQLFNTVEQNSRSCAQADKILTKPCLKKVDSSPLSTCSNAEVGLVLQNRKECVATPEGSSGISLRRSNRKHIPSQKLSSVANENTSPKMPTLEIAENIIRSPKTLTYVAANKRKNSSSDDFVPEKKAKMPVIVKSDHNSSVAQNVSQMISDNDSISADQNSPIKKNKNRYEKKPVTSKECKGKEPSRVAGRSSSYNLRGLPKVSTMGGLAKVTKKDSPKVQGEWLDLLSDSTDYDPSGESSDYDSGDNRVKRQRCSKTRKKRNDSPSKRMKREQKLKDGTNSFNRADQSDSSITVADGSRFETAQNKKQMYLDNFISYSEKLSKNTIDNTKTNKGHSVQDKKINSSSVTDNIPVAISERTLRIPNMQKNIKAVDGNLKPLDSGKEEHGNGKDSKSLVTFNSKAIQKIKSLTHTMVVIRNNTLQNAGKSTDPTSSEHAATITFSQISTPIFNPEPASTNSESSSHSQIESSTKSYSRRPLKKVFDSDENSSCFSDNSERNILSPVNNLKSPSHNVEHQHSLTSTSSSFKPAIPSSEDELMLSEPQVHPASVNMLDGKQNLSTTLFQKMTRTVQRNLDFRASSSGLKEIESDSNTSGNIVETTTKKTKQGTKSQLKQPVSTASISALQVPASPSSQPILCIPKVQAPHVQTPNVQTPHVQIPHVQIPHVQIPHVQIPHVQTPHVQTPQVQAPQSKRTVPNRNSPIVSPRPRNSNMTPKIAIGRESYTYTPSPLVSKLFNMNNNRSDNL